MSKQSEILEYKPEDIRKIINDLNILHEDFITIINSIISLESETSIIWESDSQKVYYERIMERKSELEELSKYYLTRNDFLNYTLNSYQNIEGTFR